MHFPSPRKSRDRASAAPSAERLGPCSAELKLLLGGAGSPLLRAGRVQQLGKKKPFRTHLLSPFRDAASTFPPTEQPGRSGDGAGWTLVGSPGRLGSSSDHTSTSCFTQIWYQHALKTPLSVQSSLFGAVFLQKPPFVEPFLLQGTRATRFSPPSNAEINLARKKLFLQACPRAVRQPGWLTPLLQQDRRTSCRPTPSPSLGLAQEGTNGTKACQKRLHLQK